MSSLPPVFLLSLQLFTRSLLETGEKPNIKISSSKIQNKGIRRFFKGAIRVSLMKSFYVTIIFILQLKNLQ